MGLSGKNMERRWGLLLFLILSTATGCVEVNKNKSDSQPDLTRVSTTIPKESTSTTTATTLPISKPPETEKIEVDEPPLGLDLDEANIVKVEFTKDAGDSYTFTVTVLHNDTGWEHYADWWRIISQDGEELGRRVLLHPHEKEQPFTRSLSGVSLPDELTSVVVEGHDSVHGLGGQTIKVDLKTGETSILVSNSGG
jgi:hypothetical protein